MTSSINPILRGAYYAFIFFAPLEYLSFEIAGFNLTKIFGYIFLLAAFMQPQVSFGRIPKAFWFFLSYVYFVILFGFLMGFSDQTVFLQGVTLLQLIIVFLLSYNLMREEAIKNGTLLTLVLSLTFLALYLLVAGTIMKYGRITTMGINPNTPGVLLALGLTVIFGIGFLQKNVSKMKKNIFLVFAGFMILGLVSTGSRGAVIALIASLSFIVLFFRGTSSQSMLKVGIIVVLLLASLIVASYQIEAVRSRWERTIDSGDMAGRDLIYEGVWKMFKERPILGWGPVNFIEELGARTGHWRRITPHNMLFWVVLETGMLGAALFLRGLWICGRSGWSARGGSEGILPMAVFVCLMVVNISGTYIFLKIFWIILAYVLASGHYRFPTSNKASSQAQQATWPNSSRETVVA